MFNIFQLNSKNDYEYILNSIGEDISINNNPAKAIITNTDLNQTYDNKKISTLAVLNRGDIINYDYGKWLITSEVNGQRYNKYKGIMRKCIYDIWFKTGETKEQIGTDGSGYPVYEYTEYHQLISVYVDSKTFDIETGQIFSMPSGTTLVTLQENEESLKIKLGTRFIKMGSAWEIVGIDRTKKGLITFTSEITGFNSNDDKVNEIAYKYEH